jgi:hypothetical protein
MTAPRRLLEDPASLMSDGGELGKALLESGLVDSSSGKPWADAGPSASLKAEMWSSIEAALPLVGAAAAAGAASSGAAGAGSAAGGAAAGGAAAGSAGAGTAAAGAGATAVGVTAAAPVAGLTFVTKIGLASIFVGGSLAGAGVVRQQMNEAEAPPAIVAPADPAPFASGDGSQRLPAIYDTIGSGVGGGSAGGGSSAVVHGASDPAPASTERPGTDKRSEDASERAAASKKDDKARSTDKQGDTSSSASKLVEEAAAVQQARKTLAQGNPSGALSILSQLDKDIPRGGLGQERAILSIEALAASGQKSRAAQLANAFLAANPTSPYGDRARRHAQ